jgi:hypothetical protein
VRPVPASHIDELNTVCCVGCGARGGQSPIWLRSTSNGSFTASLKRLLNGESAVGVPMTGGIGRELWRRRRAGSGHKLERGDHPSQIFPGHGANFAHCGQVVKDLVGRQSK